MLRPEPLKNGDKVAIIAPASCVKEKEIKNTEKSMQLLGLEPIFYPSCFAKHGYLAGTDDIRLKDLHEAFLNKEAKAVICIRGGYGCGRIIKDIDFDIIKENPKLFLGYSDISVIHIAINQICDIMTIHGTMPSINWERSDEATVNALKKCLFDFPEGQIMNPPGEKLQQLVPGKARGRIIGGNLSLLVSTLGSPFEIDTKGKILFIEDIGEKPYSIDRMLNALSLSGKFDDAVGIILGPFVDCEETTDEPALTVHQIFDEVIKPHNKPTIMNFRCGHIYPQITFPMGAMTEIDADDCTIRFIG